MLLIIKEFNMAIECARRTDYLQYECSQKGLTVIPVGKKLMKDDYVRELRNYYLNQYYGSKDNIPWSLSFMLSIECPQLCRRIKDLKESQQQMVWESSDWIAEEKIDGCFAYDTPVLLADGTTLPIGKIVEEKLKVSVLSLNISTGEVEAKPVVNWFDNGYKTMNDWCFVAKKKKPKSVLGTTPLQKRFITKNHKVWNGFDWVDAEHCDTAYGVTYSLNDVQKQVLYGMFLGDSLFRTETHGCEFRFFHGEKQKDYFDKKASLFDRFIRNQHSRISDYGSLCYSARILNPYLYDLHALNDFHDRNTYLSDNFISSLTKLSLAIWYMDDGSRCKGSDELCNTTNKHSRVIFAACRYSKQAVDQLVDKLNQFGYCAKSHERLCGKNLGYAISLSTDGSQKFFADIAKYIPKSMAYKIPEYLQHECGSFEWWSMTDLKYGVAKLDVYAKNTHSTSKKKIKSYDIEVADNHNYVANGMIVHNCRMLILWDAKEKKFHFFSRNNSTQDYLPQDYSDTILVTSKDFDYPENFVLDSEIISTNSEVETNIQCLTQLQSTAALLSLNAKDSKEIQKKSPLKFIVFDCLLDGDRLIDSTWTVRHTHAEKLTSILLQSGFCCELNKVVENTDDNPNAKREFFEEVIERNGEGAVLKNRNAKYHATSSRTIDCVKVKRSTNDSLTKDLDAFITDYVLGKSDTRNENMVVGFVFSVKLKKNDGSIVIHPIAVCSNVSDFIKEDATVIDENGNVTMNKNYYGRVATLQGQNISARSLRLTHSIIDVWRPEKDSSNCEILKESELRKLVF